MHAPFRSPSAVAHVPLLLAQLRTEAGTDGSDEKNICGFCSLFKDHVNKHLIGHVNAFHVVYVSETQQHALILFKRTNRCSRSSCPKRNLVCDSLEAIALDGHVHEGEFITKHQAKKLKTFKKYEKKITNLCKGLRIEQQAKKRP